MQSNEIKKKKKNIRHVLASLSEQSIFDIYLKISQFQVKLKTIEMMMMREKL